MRVPEDEREEEVVETGVAVPLISGLALADRAWTLTHPAEPAEPDGVSISFESCLSPRPTRGLGVIKGRVAVADVGDEEDEEKEMEGEDGTVGLFTEETTGADVSSTVERDAEGDAATTEGETMDEEEDDNEDEEEDEEEEGARDAEE